MHDKTASKSGVTVHGRGIPFLWGCLPPKRVGCSLTEHNFLNLYICILFDQFLGSNLIDKHSTSNIVKFMEQYVSILFKHFQE